MNAKCKMQNAEGGDEMMNGIVIKENNEILIVDIPENGERLYKIVRKTIGGYMEHVYPKGLPNGYVMIVDEEGKLKGKSINAFGSNLHQSHAHGDYIVGDVIILKLGTYRGERDIVGIPDDELDALMGKLFAR